MITNIVELKQKYNNYKDINGKIAREIEKGNLISLVRGLYETNSHVDGYLLAQYILAPSYLSFDFALAFYNLIPEATYNVFTCASFEKRKTKIYKNKIGTYIYRDVPSSVFSYGIKAIIKNGYGFNIATAEKALCDKLYEMDPVYSVKQLRELLFEDLRIDEETFYKLNFNEIRIFATLYKSKNLNILLKLINKDSKLIYE